MSGWNRGRASLMEDLVVLPGHRGSGLGRALLAAAVARAEDTGLARLSLLTDADNHRAQRLYRQHGFVASSMVVMRRALPGADEAPA